MMILMKKSKFLSDHIQHNMFQYEKEQNLAPVNQPNVSLQRQVYQNSRKNQLPPSI